MTQTLGKKCVADLDSQIHGGVVVPGSAEGFIGARPERRTLSRQPAHALHVHDAVTSGLIG
jgi:hypothetical protein